MESEKKVGFFSKCFKVIKDFTVNTFKTFFGSWSRAGKTVGLVLVLGIAEYYIPGVTIFALCALGAVMAIMYLMGRVAILITASMKGIGIAEAELQNSELSILR